MHTKSVTSLLIIIFTHQEDHQILGYKMEVHPSKSHSQSHKSREIETETSKLETPCEIATKKAVNKHTHIQK